MKCTDLQMLFDPAPGVLTPSEISTIIRASESYLYRLIMEGRLPCFCIGTHYRVLKQDVIRCLEEETSRAEKHARPPPES